MTSGRIDRRAVFDYWWLGRAAAAAGLGAGRGARARREAARSRFTPATTRRSPRAIERLPPSEIDRRVGRGARPPAAGHRARERSRSARTSTGPEPARLLSAGHGIRRPRAGLGRRDSPRPRARRHRPLHRELGGARRAHHRAARRLRHLRGADRTRRRRAPYSGARRHRLSVARLPPARCRSAALGRDRRLRGRAQGPRAPQVGGTHLPVRLPGPEGRRSRSSTSITASACSSGSSGSRSASSRRSSWSSATPAKTSSSSRSSGSISCSATPARRGRRSTGWAARPGKRPRPASRRRCATWPRSC